MNVPLFADLVVNGETVQHAVIAAEAQHHHAPKGKPGIAWRKAANAVAVRTLLLQDARRRGLSPEPAEVGPGRFETGEEALIRGLLEIVISAEPPAEDEIHAEWACDPNSFRAPPLWEVSHILVACDPRDEAATAAARGRAEDLARRAQQEPEGFARLAADSSDCGSRAAGGALGQIGPGDSVPEFEAALRGMVAGQISAAPVLSRHGWHIIRMEAVGEGAVLPYAAVRGRIAEAMEKAAWARAARDYVGQLVGAAEISGAGIGMD